MTENVINSELGCKKNKGVPLEGEIVDGILNSQLISNWGLTNETDYVDCLDEKTFEIYLVGCLLQNRS